MEVGKLAFQLARDENRLFCLCLDQIIHGLPFHLPQKVGNSDSYSLLPTAKDFTMKRALFGVEWGIFLSQEII